MWSSERILLVCLLGIGLMGLVMTYGSRVAVQGTSASLPDSVGRDAPVLRDARVLREVRGAAPGPEDVRAATPQPVLQITQQ